MVLSTHSPLFPLKTQATCATCQMLKVLRVKRAEFGPLCPSCTATQGEISGRTEGIALVFPCRSWRHRLLFKGSVLSRQFSKWVDLTICSDLFRSAREAECVNETPVPSQDFRKKPCPFSEPKLPTLPSPSRTLRQPALVTLPATSSRPTRTPTAGSFGRIQPAKSTWKGSLAALLLPVFFFFA